MVRQLDQYKMVYDEKPPLAGAPILVPHPLGSHRFHFLCVLLESGCRNERVRLPPSLFLLHSLSCSLSLFYPNDTIHTILLITFFKISHLS